MSVAAADCFSERCVDQIANRLQNIIQTAEQMRHSFLGFVAHVGKAKGFAPNFAIPGVDHQMMFFTKCLRQLEDVDFLVVLDAGESL